MSLFERIQKKIIIESGSDTTGQNKGNKNRNKKFSSNISRTVNPSDLDPKKLRQQELPLIADPVKGVETPRDIIGGRRPKGRRFGSKNKPKPEPGPYQQQELPFDDGNEKSVKKRAPRKGVDYFFDPDKAKADREKLISKRKEYGIDRKGNMSDAGAERYARKTKQLSSGSNIPVKITQADKDLARRRAVGGDKITDSSGKVIGTTTGKYGGNLPRKRPSNAKSLEQIQKEIDSRPPDARTKPKLIKTKVSDKEIQDLIKQGKQAIPKKSTKVTPTNIEKIGRAKQGLDDLIIEPKAGEVEKTKKLLRKQQRIVTKRITTPSAKEIEQSQKILDKTQTKPKTSTQNLFDITGKKKKKLKTQQVNFDKFMKNLKLKSPPKTTGLYDPLKNKIPKLDPLKPLKIPKLKPSVVTKTATKTKLFPKLMKAASRNPKTALAVGLLGLGTYGAIKNRTAVKNSKKNKMLPPVSGGGNTVTTKPRDIELFLRTDSSRK